MDTDTLLMLCVSYGDDSCMDLLSERYRDLSPYR
jgi:hypothetical protein